MSALRSLESFSEAHRLIRPDRFAEDLAALSDEASASRKVLRKFFREIQGWWKLDDFIAEARKAPNCDILEEICRKIAEFVRGISLLVKGQIAPEKLSKKILRDERSDLRHNLKSCVSPLLCLASDDSPSRSDDFTACLERAERSIEMFRNAGISEGTLFVEENIALLRMGLCLGIL